MSKFFTFSGSDPEVTALNVLVRLETVVEAFVCTRQDYDEVKRAQERKRSFLIRLLTDWSEPTETIEVEEKVWYKVYEVVVSDRLTGASNGRQITIASTKSKAKANALLAELRGALEAS